MCRFACVMIACIRTGTTQTELHLKVVRMPINAVVMQKPTLALQQLLVLTGIVSGTSTITDVNKRNDDEHPGIVVNELLCFVAYKLNLMAPDTIVFFVS